MGAGRAAKCRSTTCEPSRNENANGWPAVWICVDMTICKNPVIPPEVVKPETLAVGPLATDAAVVTADISVITMLPLSHNGTQG